MNDVRGIAYKTIKNVASPLKFFTAVVISLAVIIVVGLTWESGLPPDVTANIIYMTFGMFLIVIVVVTLLIVFFPKKLVFDQETHLAVLREGLRDNELPTPYGPRELSKIDATREIADKEDA